MYYVFFYVFKHRLNQHTNDPSTSFETTHTHHRSPPARRTPLAGGSALPNREWLGGRISGGTAGIQARGLVVAAYAARRRRPPGRYPARSVETGPGEAAKRRDLQQQLGRRTGAASFTGDLPSHTSTGYPPYCGGSRGNTTGYQP